MKKQVLNTFIDKYSLNGTIESVKWVVDNKNKQIKTSSISDDKNVVSYVSIKDDAGLSEAEIGINDTAKLKKLLGVLTDDVNITFNKRDEKIVSLSLNSESTDVQYVTADLSVIPKVPDLKKLPPFNLEIPLTKEFVTTFVKAKSALSDVDTMTFTKDKKDKIKLTIGYSSVNSNRINIDVKPIEGKDTLGKTIHFSAKYLKEILTSNSDCENAVLKISDAGIAHVEFNNELFSSSYYLIDIKSVD
jgi:hypothetical protein